MRDVFSEPSEPRRPISGTTAMACVLDSVESRSECRGRPSVLSSRDADERVLRDLLLLWLRRSRSLSLSLSLSDLGRGLLRSRSGSFLLRRRCESDEFNMLEETGWLCWCTVKCGPASWTGSGLLLRARWQARLWPLRIGPCRLRACTLRGCAYQDGSSPCICGIDTMGACCLGIRRCGGLDRVRVLVVLSYSERGKAAESLSLGMRTSRCLTTPRQGICWNRFICFAGTACHTAHRILHKTIILYILLYRAEDQTTQEVKKPKKRRDRQRERRRRRRSRRRKD